MKKYCLFAVLMMVGLAATLYGQCPFISAVNIIDEDGCGGPARIEVIASPSTQGNMLVYSINGGSTYNNTFWFNNVQPGTYNITVLDVVTDCEIDWPPPVVVEESSLTITNVSANNLTNCGASNGSIVISTGGNGEARSSATEYSINGSDGPWGGSNSFSGLSAGTYSVWARDLAIGGCEVNWGDVVLTEPEPPVVDDVTVRNEMSCGGNDGFIQIFASGGTGSYEYSITSSSGPWRSSNAFPGLPAGTYGIFVRNSDGSCVLAWGIVQVMGTAPPSISNVAVGNVTSCGGNDGSISISAGGVNGLEYSISGPGGPWILSSSFSGLTAGNYDVWVRYRDATCPVNWGTETISEPNTISITSVDVNDVSNCGESDGSIAISTISASSVEYSISGQSGPWFSTFSFGGLPAGNYEIWVRNSGDEGSCIVDGGTHTIGEPSAPFFDDVNIQNVSLCGRSDGSISILAGGGSGNLEYSISGSGGPWSNITFYEGLPAGSYKVWVRNGEDGSCPLEWGTVIVGEPAPPVFDDVGSSNASDCGVSNGTISIFASGEGSLEYSISGSEGPWLNTSFFEGLSAGTYDIWIRNGIGDLCQVNWGSVIIDEPARAVISNVSSSDLSDCGASDGSISISASGGSGSLEYSISGQSGPYASTSQFNGLVAATYDVWVRNAADGSCPVNWGSVTIDEPAQPFINDVSSNDVSDCGGSDGSISVTAGGGSGNLEYSISGQGGPYGPASQFNGLIAGTYAVWVRNAVDDSCPISGGTVTIDEPATPFFNDIASSNVSDCDLSDGTISIFASGEGTLEYSINGLAGPWLSTSFFEGLGSATYDIWIRNGSGDLCQVNWGPVIIDEPARAVISNVSSSDLSDCGASDGSISISASGGSGSLEYSISGQGGPYVSSSQFNGLTAATYDVWVRNAADGSCPVNWGSVTIDEPAQPFINDVSSNDVSDCGGSDGSISVTAGGGSGNLEYSISGQGGPYVSTSQFNGLSSGTYDVWVRNAIDDNCPVNWGSVTIDEPVQPFINDVSSTDVNDCGGSDGSITISAGGGSGNLEYSIFGQGGPYSSASLFNGLSAGTYDVWVRNAADDSCPVNWGTVTINELAPPNISNVSSSDVTVCGGSDGSISISASGVNGLQYSISGPSGPWDLSPDFSGLIAGNYDVWVRYRNGACPVSWGIEIIDEPISPSITSVDVNDVSDCGASDGSITISAFSAGEIEYSISGQTGPWFSTFSFGDLAVGSYDVWVRNSGDEGVCLVDGGTFTIDEPAQPFINDVSSNDVSDCGGSDGSISVAAGGGSGSLEYSISGQGGPYVSTSQFNGLNTGTYDVWVRNAADDSCPVNGGTEEIAAPEQPVINDVSTNDVSDCSATNGSLVITANGATAALEYSIAGPTGPWSTTFSYEGLPAGTYDIWVRYVTGSCAVNWGTEEIAAPEQPVINNVATNDVSDCSATNGSLIITANGATAALEYSIAGPTGPWSTTFSYEGLPAGTYDIWVRYVTGSCAVNWGTEEIAAPEQPVINDVSTNDVSDCEATNGSLVITANGATAALEYSIAGPTGPWSTTFSYEGLPAGTYDIWVRYVTGSCAVNWGAEEIAAPEQPVINDVSTNDVSDCSATNGSLIITANGATAALEYSIAGPAGPWSTTFSYEGLPAGTYDIWVRYVTGSCAVNWGTEEIAAPEQPVINDVSTNDVSDCEATNGSLIITANGATAALEYSIAGPAGPWSTTFSYEGLPAGTYDIWVRYVTGSCAVNWGTEEIAAPEQPVINDVSTNDVSDCSATNGSLIITANGATAALEYSIAGPTGPWSTTFSYEGLPAGTYDIWVRYVTGSCAVNWGTEEIAAPEQPVINDVSTNDVSDCSATNGSLIITANGATAALEYSIAGPTGPWSTTFSYEGLPAGTYDIWVRYVTGSCAVNWGTEEIAAPEQPVINDVSTNDVSDCSATNGSLIITANGATAALEYSIAGPTGPWSTTFSYEGLPAGTYDIWVRYVTGSCAVNWGTEEIAAPEQPVINDVSTNDVSDCSATNGSLIITANGATAALEYSIAGPAGPWSTTFSYEGLPAGTYDIWVRYVTGSCAVNWGTEEIAAPEQPVINDVATNDVSDCSATNGSLIITANGATAALEYSIAGPTGPWSTTFSYEGLPAGTYDIWVRYVTGSCAVNWGAEEIAAPEQPVINDVATNDVSDCSATNGSLIITANGATAALEYSIAGPTGPWSTTFSYEGLPAGTYDIWVRYVTGSCAVNWGTEEIAAPEQPVINDVAVGDIEDCGSETGSLLITASGGSGSLEYSIGGPAGPWSTAFSYEGLPAGVYNIWVRNAEAGSCASNWGTEEIAAPEQPVINDVAVGDIEDCGSETGSLLITASGGSGSLEYSIGGPAGPWSTAFSYEGLPAGVYNIWIRNAEDGSCLVNWGEEEIEAPELPVINDVDVGNISDCDANDGSLQITASGGPGGLEYSISGPLGPWSTTFVYEGLAAGTYNIWVRNALQGSCSVNWGSVGVEAPQQPTIEDVMVGEVSECDASNGSLMIFANGSSANLEYSIGGPNGPWSATFAYEGLPTGIYDVWVRYITGSCAVNWGTVEIEALQQLAIAAVNMSEEIDCGTTNGFIEIATTSSGPSSVLYSISGPAGPWNNDSLFINLSAGSYDVWVRFSDGSCPINYGSVELNERTAPAVAGVFDTPASDCSIADGTIVINVAGLGNYQYSLDGMNWQTSNTFDGLFAGTYTPLVRNESDNCVSTDGGNVIITAPGAPDIQSVALEQISDCDATDGRITIEATIESEETLFYSINNGLDWSDSPDFESLPAGNYQVAVRGDDLNCIVRYAPEIIISTPASPQIAGLEVSNPTDCGLVDGSILISAVGSSALEYSIDGGVFWQGNPQFFGLPPGSYPISIRNANGSCPLNGQVVQIEELSAPTVAVQQTTVSTDCTFPNGSISLTGSSGTGSYQYRLNDLPWQDEPDFPGLAPGDYQTAIRNQDTSCETLGELINLGGTPALSLINVVAISPDVCRPEGGLIRIEAIYGGEQELEFSVDGGTNWSNLPIFLGLTAGNYTIQVRSLSEDCLQSWPEEILLITEEVNPLELAELAASAPSTCEAADGEISLTVTGGSGLYEYSVDGGQSWQSAPNFVGLTADTYQIVVRDESLSCLESEAVVRSLYPEGTPEIETVDFNHPTDCNQQDGQITVVITNAGEALQYSIDGGENYSSANIFTGLAEGLYTISVFDPVTGCTINYFEQISIETPSFLDIGLVETTAPSGCEAADGSISLTLNNPDQEFEISYNGGGWQSATELTGLTAGQYVLSFRNPDGSCQLLWPDTLTLIAPLDTEEVGFEAIQTQDCESGGSISIQDPASIGQQYSIDGGQNWQASPDFFDLLAGTYLVMIADESLYCQGLVAEGVTLIGPEVPAILGVETIASEDCNSGNGSLIVNVVPGSNYTYSLDDGMTTNNSGIFTELLAGEYSLLVIDTLTSCSTTIAEEILIDGILPLNLDSLTSAGPVCSGESNGMAAVVPTGGTMPYTYNWSVEGSGPEISNLSAGTYGLTVSGASGCIDSVSFEIPEPPGLADWGIELQDTVLCEGSELTLTANLPELADFYWQDEAGTQYNDTTVTFNQAGVISFYALTLEGCELTDEFELSIQQGEFLSDFLMPAEGVINDPIVLVDISWPVPQAISWVYDQDQIETLASLPTQEILSFPTPGTFVIGLSADLGGCTAYLEKSIRIFESRDSLDQVVPPSSFNLIESFELFPNPNDGDFEVRIFLNEVQAADFWIFSENGGLIDFQQMTGQDYYALPYNNGALISGVYTAIVRAGEEWLYLNFIVN